MEMPIVFNGSKIANLFSTLVAAAGIATLAAPGVTQINPKAGAVFAIIGLIGAAITKSSVTLKSATVDPSIAPVMPLDPNRPVSFPTDAGPEATSPPRKDSYPNLNR